MRQDVHFGYSSSTDHVLKFPEHLDAIEQRAFSTATPESVLLASNPLHPPCWLRQRHDPCCNYLW